ncbi:hypothetical protein ILYODFUR_034730 [Ilyodon furcidens]|uniref:Uncharacterized protein n=1 Tax=Ilyodon furcidens TaxID=33524 RepID=A0ABV0VAF0_9TELE
MKLRCLDFVHYLRLFPDDFAFVHLVLQAEFLGRVWLDAPAPLSAGGPFAPLLEAVSAAYGAPEPQPADAGPPEPQPAAAGLPGHAPEEPVSGLPPPPSHVPEEPMGGLPPHPRHVPEEPVGGLPPRPGPEHLLSFLWGVCLELFMDFRSAADASSDSRVTADFTTDSRPVEATCTNDSRPSDVTPDARPADDKPG